MFIGLTEFYETLKDSRICHVGGRTGSGKTLFATAMAFKLWSDGFVDYIYTCYPCVANSKEKSYTDAVVVLDEGGKVLGNRSFATNKMGAWTADLRKRNIILLVPSKSKVDKVLREMVVMPGAKYGNLIWVYKWLYQDDLGTEEGKFFLVNPTYYFGSYNTRYIVNEDDIKNLETIMTMGKNEYKEKNSNNSEPVSYTHLRAHET